MGTRNLTVVKLDKKTKVAQYGQWDGYPTGQGQNIADFLEIVDLDKFKSQVRSLKSVTSKTVRKLCEPLGDKWEEKYPGFSRDYGAGVLELIYKGITTKVFIDEEFKDDGLMCEYWYEINLDDETVFMNGGKKYTFKQWTRKGFMKKLEEKEN